ncbi:MAG: hypothetical protein RL325_782 [Planctomycetota bacterium]
MDDQPTHSNTPREGAGSATVRSVVRIAGRVRALRIAGATASLVTLALLSVAGAAALDAAVRFPAPLRAAILAAIVFLVVVDLRKFVLPAWRFRPAPVDLALRIERMRPELAGKLASAVEFELSGAARGSALALRAIRDAEERASGIDLGKVVRVKPMGSRVAMALAVVAATAWFAVAHAGIASIAARRVLMPWSDAVWPARTALVGLVADGSVAARGRPLALRARLTQGEAERERVRAEYRVTRDGAAGDWIEVGLARQPSGDFERFIDAEGDGLEVRFLTSDASTEVATVRLVPPPALVAAEVRVAPPAYAAGMREPRAESLGDGGGSRGILRDPILEGSAVEFTLTLSRALPFDAAKPPMTVLSAGGAASGADAGASIAADPADPTKWTVSCVAREPMRLSIDLVDADAIASDEPVVLAFDTIADRAPTATIAEPMQDESIVADARIPMRAESRDDIALVKAGIEISTRIGKDAAEGLVLEEPAAVAGGAGAAEAGVERELDVAKLKVAAGDTVVLRAYAEDGYDGRKPDGQVGHGRVRSAPRILRIVGEDEFERQIRGVFAGVRRDAMRVDERQAKARDALERDVAERGINEAQAAVTEGAARMREAIDQAMERLERNGRDEGVLSELAEQAKDLASAAESRSAEASGALEKAQAETDAARKAEAAKDAAERQESVRAELEDLVSLLDRDEDSWLAKRRLDALASKIRQSARETDQAARRSNGESREELSPEGRAEIDALADKQEQAAEEAEQVVQELRERAQSLKEADPQQARALEEAAKAAEDGKVREELEQGAKDAQQNRLAQSKQAQDRAASALQKASEALSEDRKVRAEELARELESLVDSIERLIDEAEVVRDEVATVGDGADADAVADRERSALGAGKLSQNTRGVATDARAMGREAARVARTLDGAAAGLGKVAGDLRAEKFDRDDTALSVDGAMKALEEALAQAQEAQDRAEDRAEEEQREELLAKYRDFLERQAGLRGSVAKIVPEDGKPLGRRELIESRRLGTVQEELRKSIADLRAQEELVRSSDALVDFHDAIDSALVDAKEGLSGGKPADAMPHEDEAVELLSAIVGALDETNAPKDEDPFGEENAGAGQQGGGGQQGAGGGMPPDAEIKLLRAMQDALARKTRAFGERAESMDAVARAQKVAELAARQQRILELGAKVAEKLRQDSGGPTVAPQDPAGGEGPKEKDPAPAPPGARHGAPRDAANSGVSRGKPA